MKKRHRRIIEALNELGGEGTVREIAEAANLSVNGVSQSLGSTALKHLLKRLNDSDEVRHGGSARYILTIEDNSDEQPPGQQTLAF